MSIHSHFYPIHSIAAGVVLKQLQSESIKLAWEQIQGWMAVDTIVRATMKI